MVLPHPDPSDNKPCSNVSAGWIHLHAAGVLIRLSQTAVLSALFENQGYVKHALWSGILTGSLSDIPGWGARKSSGRSKTAPSFQFMSCGSWGADVAAETSRRGFDCTPRTATLQSFPIKLFSTCCFSPPTGFLPCCQTFSSPVWLLYSDHLHPTAAQPPVKTPTCDTLTNLYEIWSTKSGTISPPVWTLKTAN